MQISYSQCATYFVRNSGSTEPSKLLNGRSERSKIEKLFTELAAHVQTLLGPFHRWSLMTAYQRAYARARAGEREKTDGGDPGSAERKLKDAWFVTSPLSTSEVLRLTDTKTAINCGASVVGWKAETSSTGITPGLHCSKPSARNC